MGVIEAKWRILNRNFVATIKQFVDMSILQHVANDTNAHDLWYKLATMYERKNSLIKASLMRKLVRLMYTNGDCISVQFSALMGIVNQLASTKISLDNELQALLLLSSLPDSWETLVVPLSASCQDENLSLDVIKTGLLNEHARRKESGALSQ